MLKNNSNIKSIDLTILSELGEQAYLNNYYYNYDLEYINGTYKYVAKKIMYEGENSNIPGLDSFGNISVSSKLEIPYLFGGFKYYYNKENNSKKEEYTTKTIEIFFN